MATRLTAGFCIAGKSLQLQSNCKSFPLNLAERADPHLNHDDPAKWLSARNGSPSTG